MANKISNLMIAAGLLLSASSANAALYTFSQTGFDEGASISGSFQGIDLDHDGILKGGMLNGAIQEISAFTLSFSGNSIVSAFTHTLADLTVLNYRLPGANTTLGESNPEGIATRWFDTTGFLYVSGVAANGQQGGGIINWNASSGGDIYTESPNLISVTLAAVPVPGAVWLFGSALVGLTGLKRRKDFAAA
jgi:hypothetical protein